MQRPQSNINGVDVDRMRETIETIQNDPQMARFLFRATNRWDKAGHNQTTIHDFYGARNIHHHQQDFTLESDEPPLLLGEDQGANPVEYVLTALAGCLTTSLVYHAAARGIVIDSIESELDGELDLRGFLGLSDEIRNGYQKINVTFHIEADAPQQTIDELIMLAQQRSPVFDIISNPVAVSVKGEKFTGTRH